MLACMSWRSLGWLAHKAFNAVAKSVKIKAQRKTGAHLQEGMDFSLVCTCVCCPPLTFQCNCRFDPWPLLFCREIKMFTFFFASWSKFLVSLCSCIFGLVMCFTHQCQANVSCVLASSVIQTVCHHVLWIWILFISSDVMTGIETMWLVYIKDVNIFTSLRCCGRSGVHLLPPCVSTALSCPCFSCSAVICALGIALLPKIQTQPLESVSLIGRVFRWKSQWTICRQGRCSKRHCQFHDATIMFLIRMLWRWYHRLYWLSPSLHIKFISFGGLCLWVRNATNLVGQLSPDQLPIVVAAVRLSLLISFCRTMIHWMNVSS